VPAGLVRSWTVMARSRRPGTLPRSALSKWRDAMEHCGSYWTGTESTCPGSAPQRPSGLKIWPLSWQAVRGCVRQRGV